MNVMVTGKRWASTLKWAGTAQTHEHYTHDDDNEIHATSAGRGNSLGARICFMYDAHCSEFYHDGLRFQASPLDHGCHLYIRIKH
jgi:hypothetical protein